MDLTGLPIIDWELGKKCTGSLEVAEEILTLLINSLPEDLKDIHNAYAARDFKQLQRYIHKLHGAIAYCGLPRLKLIIAGLETNLRNHATDKIESQIEQLDVETDLLLKEDVSI